MWNIKRLESFFLLSLSLLSMSLKSYAPRKSYPQYTQCLQKELNIKMETLDQDYCPSSRPDWPKKIIPWWTPSNPKEKPPYSYATLIAHAILTSQEGRLTLNDIYIWISDHYTAYSIGTGGWQVSNTFLCINMCVYLTNYKEFYSTQSVTQQKMVSKG